MGRDWPDLDLMDHKEHMGSLLICCGATRAPEGVTQAWRLDSLGSLDSRLTLSSEA